MQLVRLRHFTRAGAVLALAVASCAPAAVEPRVPEKTSVAKPESGPKNARQRLAALLREVPRSDVMGSMDVALRKELDAFIDQLGQRERAELAKNQGPFARERPLFHLLAGGTSDEALFQLASSPRLAHDLLTVRAAQGKKEVTDLVPTLRKVATSAASRWLHDRAVDAASPTALTPALLDRIDVAAQTLDRWDVVRLAREIASEKIAGDADRWIALSRAASRDLDVSAASAALEQARRIGASNPKQAARLRRADKALVAAKTVERLSQSASTPEQRVELARAQLDLGHFAKAKQALGAEASRATKHLGIAAALAEADLEGSLCPGLHGGLATTILCAAAWQADPRVATATAQLRAAWKSGAGRDDRATESYLALAQIAPWMYGAVSSTASSPQELQQQFLARLEAVQAASKEAAKTSVRFVGIELFADAIGLGFRAATATGAKVDEEARAALVQRATKLVKAAPGDPLAQAGVLAVAALAFRDEDVEPLLALLPSDVDASNYLALQVLRLWVAATKKNAELARSASGEIATLLPELSPESLDRARLVLLMAESDAALQGTDRAYAVLQQVARPLTGEGVPLELRLRAAIDVAGGLARAGKADQGAELLERVVSNAQVSQSDEKSLGLIAASYLFVLRGRAAKGDERVEYRQRLAALSSESIGANAPSAVTLWRELWLRELQFRVDEDRCGNLKPCIERAKKSRARPTPELDVQAGPEVAKLVRRGALPAGSLSLTFSFGSSGLEALVLVSPALLAAEAPGQQ